MQKVVMGVLSDSYHADLVVDELKDAGFGEGISVITRESSNFKGKKGGRADKLAEGVASGGTTGGVIGGLAGLLVGIGAIALPGIGGVLIGGPLAAALGLTGAVATTVSGAVTGAVAGGLIGGLMSLGVPEEDARYYEERVKSGAVLLAVPAREESEDRIREILAAHGASQVKHFSLSRMV